MWLIYGNIREFKVNSRIIICFMLFIIGILMLTCSAALPTSRTIQMKKEAWYKIKNAYFVNILYGIYSWIKTLQEKMKISVKRHICYVSFKVYVTLASQRLALVATFRGSKLYNMYMNTTGEWPYVHLSYELNNEMDNESVYYLIARNNLRIL